VNPQLTPHLDLTSFGMSLTLGLILRSTVIRPVSRNKSPIWGLRPDFYYCQTVAGLLIWGALSDERMDLSFTISAGPRQRSHSRVPGPWDSRPYFTASDSRLRFSSPRTTRSVTVEVFYPASTLDNIWNITRVTLYIVCAFHVQKIRFYSCFRNITPRTSHVTLSQHCWSVTSCACVEVCLRSHNLETDFSIVGTCVT
jgi:hypothetical protein